MPLELPGKPTQALLATNVILGLVIALQLSFPVAPSADETVELPDGEASLPEFGSAALNPPHLSELDAMLERPLFFNDRRMPEPPADTTPPPPPKPLMLMLQGVALAGGSRVAVLRNTSNKLLLQMAEGDTHDGWTLDEITPEAARFSRGAQLAELTVDPDSNR